MREGFSINEDTSDGTVTEEILNNDTEVMSDNELLEVAMADKKEETEALKEISSKVMTAMLESAKAMGDSENAEEVLVLSEKVGRIILAENKNPKITPELLQQIASEVSTPIIKLSSDIRNKNYVIGTPAEFIREQLMSKVHEIIVKGGIKKLLSQG